MKTDLCILAAGFSSRFHGNKLMVPVEGKALIMHLFDQIDTSLFDTVSVVTQYSEVEKISKQYNFQVIWNPHPEQGLSSSIQCVLNVCQNDQIIFLVGDQPFIKMDTLKKIVQAGDGIHIVSASLNGEIRNPMLFPRLYFDELFSLKGDQGAKKIASKHSCILIPTDTLEFKDVDTKEDLNRLFMDKS